MRLNEVASCVSIVLKQHTLQKHDSRTDDAHTDSGLGRYLASRTYSRMISNVDISECQVAADLLGAKSDWATCSFVTVNAVQAAAN